MKRTTKTLLASTVGAAGLFLASTTNASASTTVKVNKNDTVWDLSQKYGVSIKSIEALNNINQNSHLIVESQTLTIPDSDNTSSSSNTSSTSSTATSTVAVTEGDSLWAIAQKYNTTVDSLRSLNGLSSTETLIRTGQTLKVSGSADTSATTTSSDTQSSTNTESSTKTSSVTVSANHVTYTVKSGDSLYTIAQAYGVTVASLRSSNTLGSAILPGQTLTINDPTKTPATTTTTDSSNSTSSSTAATSSSTAAASSTTTAATSSSASSTPAATASSTPAATASSTTTAAASSSATTAASTTTTASSTTSTTSSTTTTSSSSVSTSSVVAYAEYLATQNIPYVYGGTTLSGFDCSGFVQYVYAHFGVSLPRTSQAQSTIGTAVAVSQAKAGDLLFWGSQGSSWHVGIYVGGTSYVAAPSSGQNVSLKSFQYFQPSFAIHMN
ncbi:C40 family peptidase [Liquorilactobacillus hordei]|uniref:Peptidoglycan endopeptidase n=1 Tax=Liquorilactobacillus hordei TaxID=468911 RepID=A0A3S6QRJ6_9LACO|nr:C40 family peptidase [Liquorilactobacillus hordei]AUJ30688.1 peptidoglycan endopeptidase [Liquorilactobacillus hordei]